MTCIFYTLGLVLLSGVTYLLRDWRSLALATSVPFFLYYFYWFVLPESPRWLLMRKRFEEANKILKSIARVNGKELPVEYTSKIQRQVLEQAMNGVKETETASMFALCRTPNMRLKTCLITLNWCASEMVYVGLSYYGPAIGSNQYMSFFLSSAVEIPSYLVCWVLMDRVGRRWPLCLSMVISGIFCIVTVLLPNGNYNNIKYFKYLYSYVYMNDHYWKILQKMFSFYFKFFSPMQYSLTMASFTKIFTFFFTYVVIKIFYCNEYFSYRY